MRVHLIMLERNSEKMKINRISVDGFKNVSDVNLELTKITSLLSINSFGKTNLLNAIDFGFQFLSELPKNKKILMSWPSGIPLLKDDKSKNYKFEIEFFTDDDQKLVIYGFEFKWKTSRTSLAFIDKEYLKIKDTNESQKYTTYIDRENLNALYKTTPSGRCDKEISIESNELLINKLKAYDNLFYLPIIKLLNDFNIYIDRHFDSSDLFESTPFVRRGMNNIISMYDQEIARTLFLLKKENKNKYDLIINTLMDLFPFIEKVQIRDINITDKKIKANFDDDDHFELSDYVYILQVTHRNLIKPIDFSEMSDGVKRILLLLTYLSLAEIKKIPLIAIEEPENSINPGLLKKFLITLDSFAENSKIIITSHSPFLINYIDMSKLYLGVPNDFGKATFRKIKKTTFNKIYSFAESSSMLTGEYLFDLMSGSEDDVDKLIGFLENE